jgi:hypothetical protein
LVQVKLNRKVLYELDGGDREKKKSYRVDVRPRCGQRVRSHRDRVIAAERAAVTPAG